MRTPQISAVQFVWEDKMLRVDVYRDYGERYRPMIRSYRAYYRDTRKLDKLVLLAYRMLGLIVYRVAYWKKYHYLKTGLG